MIIRKALGVSTVLVATLVPIRIVHAAQNSNRGTTPTAKQTRTSAKQGQHTQTEGDRIFAQQCARCHTPPDGFSPRISGTVLLHMRVRASLSARDEQELLKFLNP